MEKIVFFVMLASEMRIVTPSLLIYNLRGLCGGWFSFEYVVTMAKFTAFVLHNSGVSELQNGRNMY